jgi:hypothetical protein
MPCLRGEAFVQIKNTAQEEGKQRHTKNKHDFAARSAVRWPTQPAPYTCLHDSNSSPDCMQMATGSYTRRMEF